jgi:hypothetical protein
MTGSAEPKYLIACNYAEATNVAAKGALAFVITGRGGNLPENVKILVRSRSGRWVEKWERVAKLGNFRLKTIPPEHPRYHDERLWSRTQNEVDELRAIAGES